MNYGNMTGGWLCSCGQENPDEAAFCSECGMPRPQAAPQPWQGQQSGGYSQGGRPSWQGRPMGYSQAGQPSWQGRPGGYPPPYRPKSAPRRGLILLLALLAVLLLGGAVTGLLLWAPWKSAGGDTASLSADAPAGEASTPSPLAGSYPITIWTTAETWDLTRQQIDDFNRSNPYGIRFDAKFAAVSEPEIGNRITGGGDPLPDLYFFPQDQLALLVRAGALSPLSAETAGAVKAANDPSSVAAASFASSLYAYPLTADNGYFMYYDKTVIPERDLDSLESLIADCEKAGRTFCFETSGAWYMCSWFFATGCVSQWEVDASGAFLSVYDTFNSPEGLIAVKGMKKLLDSPAYRPSALTSAFGDGAAIVVSGVWDYNTASSLLGQNLGMTDLPSFTVDGRSYHLGSFSGCKLVGVMPQSDQNREAALHLLAQHLTGESCQTQRFNLWGWGPSNLKAQASPDVQADLALNALWLQNKYAVPLGLVYGAWWDIAARIASDVKDARTEQDLRAALQAYEDKLSSFAEVAANWGVIGSICGTNWDADFPMQEIESGVFRSELLELNAGDEFKVRQGGTWDWNYGTDGRDGANFVVEKSGSYYVVFDLNRELIYLQTP